MKKEVLYHSGQFKENFDKDVDQKKYFTIQEFYGIRKNDSFVLKRRKGRMIRNINPYYVKGTIFENRVEFQYVKSPILNTIFYIVSSIFIIGTIYSVLLSLIDGNSLLKSLGCCVILMIPFIGYIIPGMLYDEDDCMAIRMLLVQLCK